MVVERGCYEVLGVPRDLLVSVPTTLDCRFQRRGADLWRSEAVDVAEAVLGTWRSVPILDGEAVVAVPPGTQPDAVRRLRGKALRQKNGADGGDLNVCIQVHAPEPREPGDEALAARETWRRALRGAGGRVTMRRAVTRVARSGPASGAERKLRRERWSCTTRSEKRAHSLRRAGGRP